jgi:uncharacterized protein (TIGR03067 family)
MRTVHITARVALVVLAVLLSPSARAQDKTAEEIQRLQGVWTVTAAEQRGRPFDVIKGRALTIAEKNFALNTAAGNEFKGEIRVNPSTTPRSSISCTRTTDPYGKRFTR